MNKFKVETQGINTFLCYSLQKEEELDEFDYGMLRNNTIKGLFSAVLSEIDGERTIKYNITSKVTLKRFLDGEISKDNFIVILKNLRDAFENLQDYMLSTDHLFLDYDNIYVDMNQLNVYLVYLPVQMDREIYDIRQFFRDLLFCVKYKKDDDIRYVVELVNYLNSQSAFSLEKFGKMLAQVADESGRTEPEQKEVEINPSIQHKPAEKQQYVVPPVLPEMKPDEDSSGKKRGFFRSREDKKSEMKQKKSGKSKKQQPNTAAGFKIPGIEVPVKEQADIPEPDGSEKVSETPEKKKRGFPLLGGRKKEDDISQEPASSPDRDREQINTPPVAQVGGYEVDGDGRLVIKQDQQHADVKSEAFLVRSKTGEKIVLGDSVLKIGRNRKYVDYCIENNNTIGRSHADIIKTPEGYKIIDNNSKNHTYVEGIIVQSDEPVLLKHGDRIMLSDEEFMFYLY